MRRPIGPDGSSWPTKALFFSMRSRILPISQQAKLLRVIETGEFERVGSSKTLHANVRIISATNANLNDEVAAGRFRQDLLFRLNTIEIALPPLRDRREDIAPLAAHFLRQHAERYRKKLNGFEPAAHEALMRHEFPGNVRELDHVIERAVLMSQGAQIKANDLGLTTAARRLAAPGRDEPRGSGSVPDQESARPPRWQRAPGRRVVRPEPERLLPAPPALWPVKFGISPVASTCIENSARPEPGDLQPSAESQASALFPHDGTAFRTRAGSPG